MSIYSVHKVCHRVVHDPGFRERMREDPAKALADFRLTDEEREALLRGDVGRLYRLGAHAYLLGHLLRFQLLGLTPEVYARRIRGEPA
jgi:hypothetical protein